MAVFQHHPDNLIYIRNGEQVYRDTPANFAIDLGQVYPGLLNGYIERIYEPGVLHVLGTGSSQDNQPLDWPDGTNYIASLSKLLDEQTARINQKPTLTLEEAKAQKFDELDKAAANAYVMGFQSSASGKAFWYDSDKDTQTVINRQYLIALSNPAAYNSTVFFSGVPAGLTPVRAKVTASDPESTKTVQLLNAAQMVQLGNDLAAAWANVKAMLWNLQGQVNAATSIEQITAISWPIGS